MDLSIIIVSWNIREKLKENLTSLYQSEGDFSFEVFVVDNNSSDGSAEMVRKNFPQVKLKANEENLGFAKGNNQGIKNSSGDFVLLLNPDMKLFPDTLKNMLEWMRDEPWASLAGCRLVNEKGETIKHVRRFPTFLSQLAIVLKFPHVFPKILSRYLRVNFDYSRPAMVDSIRGAFFMIRREMLEKIGGLDERYFLWFEEVDFCKQVYENGGEVWYTPAAKCIDYVGQSFAQVPRGRTQGYFKDSMLKYFKKWHPAWQHYVLKSAWRIGMLIALLCDVSGVKSKAKT